MPRKILAVDDDALLRRSLAFNLERSGFTVQTASCAEDALEMDRLDVPGSTFTLLFGTGAHASRSPATVMGFATADITSVATATGSTLMSTMPIQLMGEDYIYLTIRDVGTIPALYVKDVFARLIFNEPPKSIVYDSFSSNAKVYRSPLSKLDKFDVTIVTKNNIPYDFNSFEMSFTVEVYTLGTG